ncbi:hypothetical protein H5410_002814 [Solanum commersonii]|uniref:Uncharacterized protein n=1 Tax=Solanum commersonii TaxID=4109 RepID=A0A9J6B318_SOLCO|nr:hypothetical protein H5410_002814 [Solanum commersonii]
MVLDPMKWEFRISLMYNDSYYVDESYKNCEDSVGSSGFSGADESFACTSLSFPKNQLLAWVTASGGP